MGEIQVELLQEEKSYAVDKDGKSYTVIERFTNNNRWTDYEVYGVDGGEEEVSEELRNELIEAVKSQIDDLKEQVLEKLANLDYEVRLGAYTRQDLELLDRELSGKIGEIFKEFNEQSIKGGYDPCEAGDFIEEIRRQLLAP